MGTLPQGIEIVFEMQMKRSNEKIAKRKISVPTYKAQFFFLLFEPLLFSKLITFLFFVHFK
jgi:hypothetical protein